MLGGVPVVVLVVPVVLVAVVPVVPVVPVVLVVPVVVVVVPVVPVVSVVLVAVVVPVVPVVLVPVVLVPVVPVVFVVVVDCPHAGNANTKRKVRAINIVLKYGTDIPLLVIYLTNPLTIAYLCKQCNVLRKRQVAAPPSAAKGVRTFHNTSTTTHLMNKMMPSLSARPSEPSRAAATKRRGLAASSPSPPPLGRRSARPGRYRYAAWRSMLPGSLASYFLR
jgi:hypothetical protein